MERIRRVGWSTILSDLGRKGMSGGRDEERVESMNVVPDTVVGTRVMERGSEDKTKGMNEDMMDMTVMRSVRVDVSDLKGWESVDERVSELVIGSKCCNEEEVTEVDLGRFVSLKVFEVGDDCFEYVDEVKQIGLSQLERVVIGQNSFTKCKNGWPTNDPDRHFYLKNCERVRELKIGHHSFSDYSICEIENVPSLEVIEIGELNEWSYNFCYASLELKSDCERMELLIDMPSLKSALFGNRAFENCSHVVFESEWLEKRMMNRFARIEVY